MPRAPSEPALPRPIDLAQRRAVRGSASMRAADEGTSSEALVTRAQRGDLDAWSRLYREHFDAVFRHVCYLTGDAALAEDLVQDAFARAMTNASSYDGRSSFLNWLRGIALNVVRKHWRKHGTPTHLRCALRAQASARHQETGIDQPPVEGQDFP